MAQRSRKGMGALCAIGLLLSLSGCGPLGQEGLQREIESIQSAAAEGALVADGVAGDGTKTTFVRVHTGELAGAVEQSSEKLNDATLDPRLRPDANAAIGLADKVSGDLDDLEISPDDRAQAAQIAAELRRVADRAGRLAGSL